MHEQSPGCSASRSDHLSPDVAHMDHVLSEVATVAQLVAARAVATPELIAIDASGKTLSYRELEERASQLAHHLQALGAGPDSLVVICLERSEPLIVTALAVVKTGAAYVPLDPAWPSERLRFMLKDSGAALLVTEDELAGRLPAGNWRVVTLDREREQIAGHGLSFPPVAVKFDDLAYVIYTSGSTGQPKGVEITHGSLLNLVQWHCEAFSVDSSDDATLIASPGFDASVWEIWPYLCAGASIHVPDESLRKDAAKLRDWLIAEGITITFVPTALAELLMVQEWPAGVPLRTMLTGADTLHRFPSPDLPFTLVNNYGPTECTVVTTSGVVPVRGLASQQPTIGRPINNVQVFIVDEHLNQVPVGASGELLVGGKGLARGYRNRPDLTAEKFIPNSFSDEPGSRLYRTGDLVRFVADGEIAFLGRADDQIKIRGYRIEAGEIVTVLDRHPSVVASYVMACADSGGDKKLVAYMVPAPATPPEFAELRSFLLTNLPEYMVPAVFVLVDSLPVTSNGKVDRTALPAPDESNTLRDQALVPLESPVESRVGEIVATLLGLKQVGANDNFFLLGGHSLLATQVIARVRDNFEVDISLRTLFEAPTVAELSAEIEKLLVAKLEAMSEEEAQRRLDALAS